MIDAWRKHKVSGPQGGQTDFGFDSAGKKINGPRSLDISNRHRDQKEITMESLESLGDSLSVVRQTPTLRVQALEKLRRAIIEGKIAAGSRLVERKLSRSAGCELHGCSRNLAAIGGRRVGR